MDEEQEKKYRRKKDKVLKKHYPVSINGVEVKIINHLFKRRINTFEEVDTLVVKSFFPFPDFREVEVRIPEENKILVVKGKFNCAVWSAGNHEVIYTILSKTVL